MHLRLRRIVTCLLALLLLGEGTVCARGVEALVKRASRLFAKMEYLQAAEVYTRAYRQSDDIRLLYNIGLCHLKQHRLDGSKAKAALAREHLQRFLALHKGGARPARANEDQLQAMVAMARKLLGELDGRTGQPQGGTPLAPTPLSTDPWPAAPATSPDTGRPPATAPAIERPVSPQAAPHEAPLRSWLPWVLYGGAAALGIAATATGVSALKKASEADDYAAAGDQARLDEVRPAARQLAIATDVLIGVGAAMLVAGVVCHVVLPRRVERRVTLAPWRVAVRF